MTEQVMNETPALVAVDWGTSSFRAALISKTGKVLADRSSADGLAAVRDGNFLGALLAVLADWQSALKELPIYLCGMVGSRQGWIEAAYVPCPSLFTDIAKAVVRRDVYGFSLRFIPGLHFQSAPHSHDVMRGEETQVLGVLHTMSHATQSLFVTPGTHSKWIECSNVGFSRFKTFMTGDVFAALKAHTILAYSMSTERRVMPQSSAFSQGVLAGQPSHSLLADAFAVRTRSLFEGADFDAMSYLSGLLIGHELAAGTAGLVTAEAIQLIGSSELCSCYEEAAKCLGIKVERNDPQASFHGCFSVAQLNGEV